MYLKNLDSYNKAIQSDKSLVKLTVNVTDRVITIVPNIYVTYNNIIKNISRCLVWLKVLPIWQAKSCISHSIVDNKWLIDHYGNTFYEEIISNRAIQEKIEIIRKNSHSLIVEVNKYLKKYVKNNYIKPN
jgi:hypothetical protein